MTGLLRTHEGSLAAFLLEYYCICSIMNRAPCLLRSKHLFVINFQNKTKVVARSFRNTFISTCTRWLLNTTRL